LVEAVDEIARPAAFAVSAIAGEEADADALADLPSRDAIADHLDPADRLVAWHPRVLDRQDPSFHRRRVRVADATRFDADADVAERWLEKRLLGEFELVWTHDLHGAVRPLRGARCCRGMLSRHLHAAPPRSDRVVFRLVLVSADGAGQPKCRIHNAVRPGITRSSVLADAGGLALVR
jgi:hypothetical protein